MELGAFSVSLAVKDIEASRAFYEKFGWAASGISADFDDYCEVRVPEVEYRKILT